MSRIYEAVRKAQESRQRGGLTGSDSLGVMELPERRLSPRVELNVDLAVYGHTEGGAPFYKNVMLIKGNANGGSFLLEVQVIEGQVLLLINNDTSMEQSCRVIRVLARDEQTCEISVDFEFPNPDFWKLLAENAKK